MDPISAVGVASSALTFVEFAAGLVKKVREIEASATGRTKQNDARYQSAERLWKLSKDLEDSLETTYDRFTPEENEIRATASACIRWADTLRSSLDSFAKEFGNAVDSDGFLKSAVQALKSIWKEGEVKEAEQFLKQARRDLHIQMTKALLSRSSVIQKSIEGLISRSARLDDEAKATTQGLETMRDELLSALRAADPISPTSLGSAAAPDINQSVAQTLIAFHAKSEEVFKVKTWYILRSLWFDKITERRRRVTERHKLTCDWIFNSEHCGQPLRLLDWLLKGDEVYWITGKAGCGKSTIMKFILNDERTSAALAAWAERRHDSKVIVADFFFWRAGKYLEKSTEGLFRSLLYEVFRKRPAIIADILPERWSEASSATPARPWSVEELQLAMKSLGQHQDLGLSFCFFIDGLDEFVDSPSNITQTILDLSRTSSIKLCVSSRPWNEFEYAFGQQHDLFLAVHRHTEDDIRAYVNDLLGEHPLFSRRQQVDPRHRSIINSIVTRAQGVFLWVFLIIRALKESLPDEDSFETFQQHLDEFPSELEPFFDRMLDGTPLRHREQSSKIILMFLRSLPVWSYMPLSFVRYLTEGKDDFFSTPISEQPKDSTAEDSRILRARLKARCRDLLVVEDDPTYKHRERIIILHRTMLDYLESPRINERVWASVPPTFSPETEICRGILADWKFMGCQQAFLTRDYPQRTAMRDPNPWACMVLKNFCEIIAALRAHDTSEMIALMDEAERMVGVCWKEPDVKSVQRDILMSIAICLRLHSYVKSRITATQISKLQGTSQNALSEANYELPASTTMFTGGSAIAAYVSSPSVLQEQTLRSADVLTLKALLESGADINSPFLPLSDTCWQVVLRNAIFLRKDQITSSQDTEHGLDISPEQMDHQTKIMVLCLEHGANYDAKVFKKITGRQAAATAFAGMPELLRSFDQAAARGARFLEERDGKRKGKKSIFSLRRLSKLRI